MFQFFIVFSSSFFSFFSRPSRRQNQKKNRRIVPVVKMTISFLKIRFLGLDGQEKERRKRWVRKGQFDVFSFLSIRV